MSFTEFEVHQLKQQYNRMKKNRINNNRIVNNAIKGDKKSKEAVISVKAVYAKRMKNTVIVELEGEICIDVKALYCKAEMKRVVKIFTSPEGNSFKILKRKVANKPIATPKSVRKAHKESQTINKILGDIYPMDSEEIKDFGVQQVLKNITRKDHVAQKAAALKYGRDLAKGLKQLEKAKRRLEEKARAFDKAQKLLQTA